MKNFLTLTLCLIAFVSFAQTGDPAEHINDNPNTETAFLNYDYKFQGSGFEQVDGGTINLQPGVAGLLNYEFDDAFDYIIIGISDTLNQGVGFAGKPVDHENDVFNTNEEYVFTEWGSRIVVFPIPDEMKGKVQIQPRLLGVNKPVESCYYILMRKKQTY
jgi:hypothetical protein